MANLLPQNRARVVRAEYRDRIVLLMGLLFLMTAAVIALILLPSYLVLSVAAPKDESAEAKAREDQSDKFEITKTQSVLKDIAPVVAASSSPTRAILRALAARPKGILVDHIKAGGKPLSLVITGNGSNRDVISLYRDTLKSDPRFRTVSIPVSDIVGASEDGRFTATLISTY